MPTAEALRGQCMSVIVDTPDQTGILTPDHATVSHGDDEDIARKHTFLCGLSRTGIRSSIGDRTAAWQRGCSPPPPPACTHLHWPALCCIRPASVVHQSCTVLASNDGTTRIRTGRDERRDYRHDRVTPTQRERRGVVAVGARLFDPATTRSTNGRHRAEDESSLPAVTNPPEPRNNRTSRILPGKTRSTTVATVVKFAGKQIIRYERGRCGRINANGNVTF